jgi:hypothetical protein
MCTDVTRGSQRDVSHRSPGKAKRSALCFRKIILLIVLVESPARIGITASAALIFPDATSDAIEMAAECLLYQDKCNHSINSCYQRTSDAVWVERFFASRRASAANNFSLRCSLASQFISFPKAFGSSILGWHLADLLRSHADVRLSRQSGQHLLGVSLSAFDPKPTSAFDEAVL